jgi:hypothetical protein
MREVEGISPFWIMWQIYIICFTINIFHNMVISLNILSLVLICDYATLPMK